jgi:hypothetical protein
MDDFQALEEALHQAALDLGWLKQIADVTLQHNDAVARGIPCDMDGILHTLKDYWPKCCENRNRAWSLLYPVRHLISQSEPVAMGGESAASWCELTVQASAPGIFDICWHSPDFDYCWMNRPDLYAGMIAEALSEFDESLFIGWISIEVREARQLMLAEAKPPQPHGRPITRAELDDLYSNMLGKRVRVRKSRSEPASSPSRVTTPAISDLELNEARKLFRLSPKTPRSVVMERLAIGSKKATAILEIMRREGLCTTRPRTGK